MKRNKNLDNKIIELLKKHKNDTYKGKYDIGMDLTEEELKYFEYFYFGFEKSIYVFFRNNTTNINTK